MTALVTCDLQQRAEKLISVFCGSQRRVRRLDEQAEYVTNDGGEGWKIKILQESEWPKIWTEAALLRLISQQTPVPVPQVGERGHDDSFAWLITKVPPGSKLSDSPRSIAKMAYSEAGSLLAELQQISFADRGMFSPHLDVVKAPVWCSQEFYTVLSILYNEKLIDEYIFNQWSQLDIDYLLLGESTICHGCYSPENIYVDEGKITAITGFNWASAGPAVIDISAMDVLSKIADLSQYVDDFYKGYQSVKPVSEHYRSYAEFYRFYYTCLILAFRTRDPRFVQRLKWYKCNPPFPLK